MIFLRSVQRIRLLIKFLAKENVSDQTTCRADKICTTTEWGILESHLVEPPTSNCPLDTDGEDNTAKKKGEKNESFNCGALV